MNKAMKILFYTSFTVAGWPALRYCFGYLADLADQQSSNRDRKAYRRATERWENEGGATLAGHVGSPSHLKRDADADQPWRHPHGPPNVPRAQS